MNKIFFSIIIPTLNEELFLPKLLFDISKQSYKNFEVIVVDGKSEDKTIEKANIYKKLFTLNTFQVDTRSPSFQRNYGAKKAKGVYLIFLDADTRITKGFLKNIYKATKNNQSLMYLPQILPDNKQLSDKTAFQMINYIVEISLKTPRAFSTGGSMIIERGLFSFLKGFNDELYLCEDHNLVRRVKQLGVMPKMVSTIKIRVSLRRLYKEGRLQMFSKYLYATIQTIRTDGIKEKIFEYKMGGADYDKNISSEKELTKLKNYINKYLNKLIGILKM